MPSFVVRSVGAGRGPEQLGEISATSFGSGPRPERGVGSTAQAPRQTTVGCPHYRALAAPGAAAALHATRPGCGCAPAPGKRGRAGDVEDLAGVVNIADLRTLARGDGNPKDARGCAYHAARALAERSHVVFCPYQYLMDPGIRGAVGIEKYLEDAIAIVDEAHNVEQVARDGGSTERNFFEIASLEAYLETRRQRQGALAGPSALADVVVRVRKGIQAAQLAFCGPPENFRLDDDDPDKTRHPCHASEARRRRFRVPPDERDVVNAAERSLSPVGLGRAASFDGTTPARRSRPRRVLRRY